ncbi:META domain-containing protein [Paracoccus pacificus]|uniref:META domain-containing protein n=1 Tax=Paracoccus pacificus TaxID=1463598 RepID=A0ABW4RAI4_9RHOB
MRHFKPHTPALLLALTATLAACTSVPPPAPVREVWMLSSVNGAPASEPISFGFSDAAPVDDQPVYVSGRGPCTSYLAEYQGSGMNQRVANIATTDSRCTPTPAETQYLGALSQVVRMSVKPGQISFDGNGQQVVFRRGN